jgi:hypothetical protein
MAEPIPAGAYDAGMRAALVAAGVPVTEEPPETVRGARGSAVVGEIGFVEAQ